MPENEYPPAKPVGIFLPLVFFVYVVSMKKDKTVVLTVDKTSAVRVGEFDTSVKRASEFVADGDALGKRDHSSDMPAWGYALIFGGVAVLLAAAVVTVAIVKKERSEFQRLEPKLATVIKKSLFDLTSEQSAGDSDESYQSPVRVQRDVLRDVPRLEGFAC